MSKTNSKFKFERGNRVLTPLGIQAIIKSKMKSKGGMNLYRISYPGINTDTKDLLDMYRENRLTLDASYYRELRFKQLLDK